MDKFSALREKGTECLIKIISEERLLLFTKQDMINDGKFSKKCCSSKDRRVFKIYEKYRIGETADVIATKIIKRSKKIETIKQDIRYWK
jgi:hypothetical protein